MIKLWLIKQSEHNEQYDITKCANLISPKSLGNLLNSYLISSYISAKGFFLAVFTLLINNTNINISKYINNK